MKYEGVGFNIEAIKKFKLEEFVDHKSYQHLWPKLGEEQRKARLKELFWIATLLKPENINIGNYGDGSANVK